MLKDAGLSMATVQRAEINHAQVSTLFWFNVALSVALMLFTVALAPAIAWFYGEPRLTNITLALAVTFLFAGLTVQHQALLCRQMRFIALAGIEIASLAVSIVIAIILGVLGYGYWALVAMHATIPAVNAVLVWVLCDWRPARPRRGTGIRSMLAFGGNLTGSNMLNYVTRNMDNILIGAVWGAESLGFYTRAYKLLMLPIQQINAPLDQVAQPALSRIQEDPELFRRFYRKGISFCVTLGMPIVAFAFVAANDLVLLILGSQWSQAVPIFRALAPAAFIGTLNVATAWVFIPLGRTDKALRASFFGSTLTVIAFLVGVKWGAIGVAVAFSVSVPVKRLPQILYAFHGTVLRLGDVGGALWRPLLSSIGAAVGVTWLRIGSWIPNLFPSLLIDGLVFVAFYCTLLLIVPGGRGFLKEMIRSVKRIRAESGTEENENSMTRQDN